VTERDLRAFLPLHPMAFRILVILWRGTPAFSAQLVQASERRGGDRRAPYPKDLMRTIRDLLDLGLIEASSGPPEGDARKDWFRISQLGKKVVLAESQRMKAMVAEATEMGIL
jgi:DNA-binding PadR family transcriptional regulator